MKKANENKVLRCLEGTENGAEERKWVSMAKFTPERDQIGVLFARHTKLGRMVMLGEIETDDGPMEIVGFPFMTKKFRVGMTLCLARQFHEDGSSERADGEVVPNDTANTRKRRKKVADG